MFIRIETSSGVPITRQILDQIRTQCATGALAPHDRLPSVRELARELAVNQNTILRVYERLTAEGLIERRHGDGTYVAPRPSTDQLKAQRELLDAEAERLARRAVALGVGVDDLSDMLRRSYDAVRGGSTAASPARTETDQLANQRGASE
jgi:GntR family transcriptional regulator